MSKKDKTARDYAVALAIIVAVVITISFLGGIDFVIELFELEDVDLAVLLTHIGFEQDKQLAALLDPRWGIDLIIGGHSHTFLEHPHVEAGIPIVQAVTGTDQIGRFDILVDTDKNAVDSYRWELIPIDDSHCPRDTALEALIGKYQAVTTEKYSRYISPTGSGIPVGQAFCRYSAGQSGTGYYDAGFRQSADAPDGTYRDVERAYPDVSFPRGNFPDHVNRSAV